MPYFSSICIFLSHIFGYPHTIIHVHIQTHTQTHTHTFTTHKTQTTHTETHTHHSHKHKSHTHRHTTLTPHNHTQYIHTPNTHTPHAHIECFLHSIFVSFLLAPSIHLNALYIQPLSSFLPQCQRRIFTPL